MDRGCLNSDHSTWEIRYMYPQLVQMADYKRLDRIRYAQTGSLDRGHAIEASFQGVARPLRFTMRFRSPFSSLQVWDSVVGATVDFH